MVHMNIFCEMGLEISDPKDELWTKTEILRRFQNSVLRSKMDFRPGRRRPFPAVNGSVPAPARPGRPSVRGAAGGGWGAFKNYYD